MWGFKIWKNLDSVLFLLMENHTSRYTPLPLATGSSGALAVNSLKSILQPFEEETQLNSTQPDRSQKTYGLATK